MSSLFNLFAFLITIFLGFYTYCKWKFSYWKRRGVPYIEPKFPFGTVDGPFSTKAPLSIVLKEQYDYLKSRGHKHGGLYFSTRSTYLPIDPELIKNIMSKDFNYFMDRGVYYNEKDAPLSAHLVVLEGQAWKKLRLKLTPTFTSVKMKTMFSTLVNCSEPLKLAMDDLAKRREEVDVKDLLGRFTTDVIGSCAFGIDCNSFTNAENEFRTNMIKFFSPFSKLHQFRHIIATISSGLAKFLGITDQPKEVYDFFFNVVKQTVDYREKTNFTRPDFMQLLINLKNSTLAENGSANQSKGGRVPNLTIEEIAAQSCAFFAAGFETSSSTMNFCLFELAHNQEVQDKLRKEISEVLSANDEQLTYELVMNMKYLDQVVNETLRKYPTIPIIARLCVADYQIPNSNVVIEKGTKLMIPIYTLHHDEEYFPNPEKFDPDRFADENKHKIRPFTYLPFGEGPRICIGARFGLMQTKLGLTVLLKNFKFALSDMTPTSIALNPLTMFLASQETIYLNVERVVG